MKPFQSMTIETIKDEFENFYNHLVQILVQKVIQHQKKPITSGICLVSFDAECRDRTCDLRVTSALLYQLS